MQHKNIATTIKDYLNEQQMAEKTVRLYHTVLRNLDFDIVKSIVQNGLIPKDNGERGTIIWFVDNLSDYAKDNDFILYYDLKLSENGLINNKYGIIYDGQNGFAHKQIPFNDLGVKRIPIAKTENSNLITNEDFLREGIFKITPENFKNGVIYVDLFNKFVQPYIKEKNYIDRFSINNKLMFLT